MRLAAENEVLLTPLEQQRGMRWQIAGNGLTTVFADTNFYSSMFMLFLIAMGLDVARVGVLFSILALCGLLSPLFAPAVARLGYRFAFLLYVWIRLAAVGLLLLAPLVASSGTGGAFALVATSVLGFGVARALGDTGLTPWNKQLVPDHLRGRFQAISAMVQQICNIATVGAAGWLLSRYTGLTPFMLVISCGMIFGVLAALCYMQMPGGKPAGAGGSIETVPTAREMLGIFSTDRNFLRYCIGVITVIVAACILGSFIPLYMKNVVGLELSMVVWLDGAIMAGGLLTCYLWGAAADRLGAKPIMLLGAVLFVMVPVVALAAARIPWLGIAACAMIGVAGVGWEIGRGRYLYVNVMPASHATSYSAVYIAVIGIAGGLGQLVAGFCLQMAGMHGGSGADAAKAYNIQFMVGVAVLIVGVAVLAFTRSAPVSGAIQPSVDEREQSAGGDLAACAAPVDVCR